MRVFVTGATGWIGSAVVPELLGAGHDVVGLARTPAAAEALRAAGAEPLAASLDDTPALRAAAEATDGVLHLAFKHDVAFAGGFPEAVEADRRAIAAFGEALRGSGRPLVIASGFAGNTPGATVTERDAPAEGAPGALRAASERAALALAAGGVRSASVRLAPTVHGAGDTGFVATLVDVARKQGASGYVGAGGHWPAVHRQDAARLFRLALELAPAGSVLHAVAEEGVPFRAVAEAIGEQLGVPAVSVPVADAAAHFGWLAPFVQLDVHATSTLTRQLLGWEPAGPTLLDDLRRGRYLAAAPA